MMRLTNVALEVEGFTLRGVLHWPEEPGERVPAALLLHGIGSHSRCRHMEAVAETLRSLGMATLQMDFVGHGQSDGSLMDMTVPFEVRQARAMLELLRAQPGCGPVMLAAHSQGGTVAVLLAGDAPGDVDAMLLLAAAGHISEGCRRGWLQDARFDPAGLPPEICMMTLQLSGEYFRTGQTLTEYAHAACYPGPVCLLHAGEDSIVPSSCAVRYHQTFPDSELHLLPGSSHSFRDTLPQVLETARRFTLRFLNDYKEKDATPDETAAD